MNHSSPEGRIFVTSGSSHSAAVACHKRRAFMQVQKACKVSSSAQPQTRHVATTSKFLLCLLHLVGKQFVDSRQAKDKTLGGAGVDQIAFQPSRGPSGRVLEETIKALCCSSDASWYALFTKNTPNFSGAQAIKSYPADGVLD